MCINMRIANLLFSYKNLIKKPVYSIADNIYLTYRCQGYSYISSSMIHQVTIDLLFVIHPIISSGPSALFNFSINFVKNLIMVKITYR